MREVAKFYIPELFSQNRGKIKIGGSLFLKINLKSNFNF
jgi:hypothetical protein